MPRFAVALGSFALLVACTPAARLGPALQRGAAPGCDVKEDADFLQEGLLDLGTDASEAHAYQAVLALFSRDEGLTYRSAEITFTTDSDRQDQPALTKAGLPLSEDTARSVTVSATSETPHVEIALVTADDARLLSEDGFVQDGLGNGERPRIAAHVRVRGTDPSGAEVSSQDFTFPISLCQGCLLHPPECASGAALVDDEVCLLGQDQPLSCE